MWKKVTVVGSGAAENVMPRSMFPEMSTEETERSKSGEGFEGPGGEHIKNYGQQVVSVRTRDGFVRKSTWQVADVRRPWCQPPTSSKPGMTCSVGRKREKSMLRKEVNVHVLDMFVKVPPSAIAPSKYKLMEVDAISQVADERALRRRVTFSCSSSTF